MARVVTAIVLTALGYSVLTLYDYVAARYAKHPLPYRTVAPASFVSYALSHNLGMAALTSAPMRFRFYSAAGLGTTEIAKIVVFVSATFWLGVVALGGAAFVVAPLGLPEPFAFGFGDTRVPGAALLALAGAYLVAVFVYRRPLRLRSFEIGLPSPLIALSQVVIASADLIAASAALYVLFPAGAGVTFPRFLAIYLLAVLVGIVSQVPGGLGVFETVFVLLLAPDLPSATVLGTVLAYRVIYYVLPLFAAGVVLAVYETARRREFLAPMLGGARAWTAALAPHVAAATAFAAGAVLLFSGAMPALPQRLRGLARVLPLPMLELSHLLGSLVGVCLLFLARGLQRRLDSAYHVAVVLLGAGVLLSLAKGLDYEEAAILAAILVALLPARPVFYRKGALFAERLTPGWFTTIAIVLAASTWLGLLAFRSIEYSHELWWQFTLHGDASRFLRATVGVAALASALAFSKLLGPAEPRPEEVPLDPSALERAARIVADSPTTTAQLALAGDKRLLFGADDAGFVMYAVEGRSWFAMGDPVSPPQARRDLAWSFRTLVDRYDGWPVFYEVRTENLHLYLDLGLTLLKLGEEAVVPLEGFSLEGHSRKELRAAVRRVEREGGSFDVVPADRVSGMLPELRKVSDSWLAAKKTREKGFSLGFFDEAYLRRYSCAIVRSGGAIAAFANIWLGAGREEMSIDLMRHANEAPPGVMDYLLVELMLWGREQGYRRFNLGMAPLSGMEDRALAPLWNRVGAFIFRHADDFYGFQGLRRYKEKFDPVWEPRYLASPGGLVLPRILTNLATLIAGGVRGVLGK